MKSDKIKCPCCGQVTAPTNAVVVDLTENVLRYRQHSIRLIPRLANLAYILSRRMPETVAREAIIAQMWGNMEGDYASGNLNVGVMHLRTVLRPFGLNIINTRSIGYRMVEVSRTERPVSYSNTGAEHARA